jgi:hypothetical protein
MDKSKLMNILTIWRNHFSAKVALLITLGNTDAAEEQVL